MVGNGKKIVWEENGYRKQFYWQKKIDTGHGFMTDLGRQIGAEEEGKKRLHKKGYYSSWSSESKAVQLRFYLSDMAGGVREIFFQKEYKIPIVFRVI